MSENTDAKHLLSEFEKWVELKGTIEVATALGHETTRFVERWVKEGRLPAKEHARVIRIMSQEGLYTIEGVE